MTNPLQPNTMFRLEIDLPSPALGHNARARRFALEEILVRVGRQIGLHRESPLTERGVVRDAEGEVVGRYLFGIEALKFSTPAPSAIRAPSPHQGPRFQPR